MSTAPDAPAPFKPQELATLWRVKHDKILAFIHSGELKAFNVSSDPNGRPQFRIQPEDARRFQEQRQAVHPTGEQNAPAPRSARRRTIQSPKKFY
jgi:hypothetical protein